MAKQEARSALLIVRHAHRDKPFGREADNGLSDWGKKQARALKKYCEERFPAKSAVIESSPKLRCVETVAALGKLYKTKVRVSPLLDEGSGLVDRASQYLVEWKSAPAPLTIACSHGDWIPEFLELACGKFIDLEKGALACLEIEGDRVALKRVIQDILEAD